ncbi:protein phosphatase [Candidatus Electrothrix communis]|uniref:Protein phosphatase n=1 Tax=Candidatus Electrothrix communis TaxID=1859133 RepID=A0A3S4TCB1_9BACT|nr:protein phosphatase [Candidatus Electrothrix communis]WLE99122.1 MAG: Stp1/IreP family PP2C-type Ser/Thr phosphatase [Candidatus Electrothrix communis]
MGKIRLSAHGLTDIGLRRTSNEDNWLIRCEVGCFLVADGMGGAAAGEIASQIFMNIADQTNDRPEERTKEKAIALLKESFSTANTEIRNHAVQNPDRMGMGCTAELLLVHDRGFVLGHIGDSRSYRLRRGHLARLTKDHSLVQDQVDQGLISKDEARTHRLRNVISRAVGVNDQLEVDIIQGGLQAGDLFLLCSDGLTDMVADDEILNILLRQEVLADQVARLIELANAGGGRDNITVVLVRVDP